MKITKAEFVQSSTRVDQKPADKLPEFAFIGRSNVGKSSLINMLCSQSLSIISESMTVGISSIFRDTGMPSYPPVTGKNSSG